MVATGLLMLAALLPQPTFATPATPATPVRQEHDDFAPPYAVLDFATYRPQFQSSAVGDWAENNVPLLDFPDVDINTTYYFRWRLYHEHILRADGHW